MFCSCPFSHRRLILHGSFAWLYCDTRQLFGDCFQLIPEPVSETGASSQSTTQLHLCTWQPQLPCAVSEYAPVAWLPAICCGKAAVRLHTHQRGGRKSILSWCLLACAVQQSSKVKLWLHKDASKPPNTNAHSAPLATLYSGNALAVCALFRGPYWGSILGVHTRCSPAQQQPRSVFLQEATLICAAWAGHSTAVTIQQRHLKSWILPLRSCHYPPGEWLARGVWVLGVERLPSINFPITCILMVSQS
jgi:hypothetical protein